MKCNKEMLTLQLEYCIVFVGTETISLFLQRYL